jgi:glutamine amidotransferase
MCRHLACVGSTMTLAEALFDAPHALARQAEHPEHQTVGESNPDGWGVAWYSNRSEVPVHYRTVTPIWEDRAFASRAAAISSSAFLAAARLASPGATLVDTGNAPFVAGRWAFSLNGIVHGFRDDVGGALRAELDPSRVAGIVGDADTEVLFALVLQRLEAGEEPARALAAVINHVTTVTTGRFNLLLTDGQAVYGTRYGNSLFQRDGALASEPLDDEPGWQEVADESLVVVGSDGASVTAL